MKTKLLILALVSSSSAFAITLNYSDSSVNSESESSLFSSSSDYKQNRPALAKMSIQKLMQAPEARTYQGEFVMLRDVLKVANFDPQLIVNRISQIVVPKGNVLIFHLADGSTVERTWQDRSRRESWTPEMREKARQRSIENSRLRK